jgi:DNA-directed RNA polymerase subunit RPC12/RpoP
MGRGKNLSEAMKAEIIRMSREGKTGSDIGRVLGISRGTVSAFLTRHHQAAERVCEFCGKTIKDGEALYCPYCGKKILTDKDRLDKHIQDISIAVCEMPTSQRERILGDVAEIRKLLKKMGVGE